MPSSGVAPCPARLQRSFRVPWQTEYAAFGARPRIEAIDPIQKLISAFLANQFIRSMLRQNSSTLKIPHVMNTRKLLIVDLSKGNLVAEPAHLLGALLASACAQAAEARSVSEVS